MAVENLRDEVEQDMKEVKERMNHLRNLAPWWYSGSACLAALAWLSWFTLAFMLILGRVEPSWVTGVLAVVIFLVAMGSSVQGAGKR